MSNQITYFDSLKLLKFISLFHSGLNKVTDTLFMKASCLSHPKNGKISNEDLYIMKSI